MSSMNLLIACNGMAAKKLCISFKNYNPEIKLFGIILKSDIHASYLNDLEYVEFLNSKSDFTPENILDFCLRNKIDYVHPGWGFLAENAEFIATMENNNIKICAPTSDVVDVCGSKIKTIQIAESLNVPIIPYFPLEDLDATVKKITDMDLTFPLMYKASDEGGGRGIVTLWSFDDVVNQYGALDKSKNYYVTKKITNAKHIEVQILADMHGNTFVASLRDCSSQRRFQKMIEESLVIGDNKALQGIADCALKLVQSMNYRCAGTVEFLYSMDDERYYLLEINPRLQVEHPCTEGIYNINIPAIMLEITMGRSLLEIFNVNDLSELTPRGNCIAARITCEDPYTLQPTNGMINEIQLQTISNGWGYFCYSNNAEISGENDCQIGHLFAYGATRNDARNKLIYMLDRLIVTGTVKTSVQRLLHILRSNDFYNNRIDTLWVERNPMESNEHPLDVIVTSLVKGHSTFVKNRRECEQLLGCGHIPPKSLYNKLISLKVGSYSFHMLKSKDTYQLIFDNKCMNATVTDVSPLNYVVSIGEQSFRCYFQESDFNIISIINGKSLEFSKKSDDELIAEVGGKMVTKFVNDREHYKRGDKLALFEIMKMQYTIVADNDGRLVWNIDVGEYVTKGHVLGKLIDAQVAQTVSEQQNVVERLMKQYFQAECDYEETPDLSSLLFYNKDKSVSEIVNYLFHNEGTLREVPVETNKACIMDDFMSVFSLSTNNMMNLCDSDSGINSYFVKKDQYRFVLTIHDNSVNHGALGQQEYTNFVTGSRYAKLNKLPFIYISSCSGAKIGVYDKILPDIQVHNNENGDFEYFYLTNENYGKHKNAVNCVQLSNGNWQIRWILGEGDIGIENLHGSGQIAHEMSSLYEQVPTISFVTKFSVGIGAYVCMLGRRIIQKRGSPLLLTGYQALNKLLGNKLYINNQQLGDSHIMSQNGITTWDVGTDVEGVQLIKTWYEQTHHLPLTETSFTKSLKYNFCDENSFIECYKDWGTSVYGGYGRVNGRNVGIIVGNDVPTTKHIPADPGNVNSSSNSVVMAGNVLYPDSSHKVAQLISNFNRDGLPLVVVANFVGFSGGTRDMYDRILKFGSKIVDELRLYKQNVVIYIPARASFRGGAFVVFAKSINESKIKLFADPTAEMNVLEASGLAEIKCRKWNENTKVKEAFCRLHDSAYRAKELGVIDDVVDEANIKNQIYTSLFNVNNIV